MLVNKISGLLSSYHRSFGPMDDWHKCAYVIRKFLRGWSRNRAAEARREKTSLEAQIAGLDLVADGSGLSKGEWSAWYALEVALMQLHQQAEIYWRQRGTLNWTLKGDSLTAYFFAIANGRRRRCPIDSLLINGVRTSNQSQILSQMVDFFTYLMSAKK